MAGLIVFGLVSFGLLHAQQPGAAIFAANCGGCHGADGRGGEHAPNIATAPEAQHLMDREIAGILKNGIPGAGMPAFPSLKQQEVSDVISHLRALQGRGNLVKLPGDPRQGKVLFFGKALCSDCHMVNGRGGFIGGDLSFYGANARTDEIRGIVLDPEKNLPTEKKATTLVTVKGEKLTGMLRVNDNFSVTIQTLDGAYHFLPKSELAELHFGSNSLMPAGSTLSNKDVDDLVSYLIRTGSDAQPSKSDDDDN